MREHPCYSIVLIKRGYRCFPGCLLVALVLALTACASSESSEVSNDNSSSVPSMQPGDTFDLGETRMLTMNGIYLLPVGATSITTRCTGNVTIEIPTVPSQTNTCNSPDGSQSITNLVTGVSEVIYTFGEDASARVTVN